MTDDSLDPVEREFETHDAFELADDGYVLETTAVDATATADDGAFCVVVALPTLDAAVSGETVAPVVEDGWFETLERRLADAFSVARTDAHDEPRLERDAREVRVILAYDARDAATGVDDAKALAEFVEGTFVQGLVPGYEYRGAAKALLENAQSQGQGQGQESTGSGGGTPM